MRSSRLLSILLLVQLRGQVSAPALAREFEVSVRTIYRDVDALSAAGAPIYAEPGRNGGIRLHEGFRARLTGLTAGEAAALPFAGLAGAAADLGLAAEAAAAQLKMLASLPQDTSTKAQAIAERFHVDPAPWYRRTEAPAHLAALADAVWRDRRVSLVYESWSKTTRRTVDPLGLVHKGGVWYLVGAWRGKPLTYRADAIVALTVLEGPAKRPAGFALAAYWTKASADFEARLIQERATVLISEEGRRLLRAEWPVMAHRVDATARPVEPGSPWMQAELPFENAEYSARQILRLGAEVVVLAPEALRLAIAKEAAAVAALYPTAVTSLSPSGA